MPVRETSREIDRRAALWAARLDRGPLSTDERQALEQWVAADPHRQGALARAMAISAYCDDAAARASGREPLDLSRQRVSERVVGRRGFMYGAAAAVGGLTVLAAGWSSYGHQYSTGKGEFRSVRLEDGSVIWLNTESSIRVRYSGGRRDIKLAHGEAWFDVAKDRSRPFVVRAAGVDVRAVGTCFSVSNISADRPVEVLVQEGLVDVAKTGGSDSAPVRLTAGAHAVARASGVIAVSNPGVDVVSRALSWRQGMLDFEGVTLAEAANTFARYSNARILVDDPAVSRLTVTGLFASTDPAGFANAVAASLNLRVRRDSEGIHLSR